MKHVIALILKYIVIAIVFNIILMAFTALDFGQILVISLVETILAYIGDLTILPATNNTISTIIDIGLALIVVLLFNYIYPGVRINFLAAFVAAIGIGIVEIFFHKFVSKNVLPAHS